LDDSQPRSPSIGHGKTNDGPQSGQQSHDASTQPSSHHGDTSELIRQPETKPISHEQLVAEVKGIYAGLVMVESKCIEVDNAQSAQDGAKLNNEQWQALIALHRTLLHEHHDFFLASQHPSASAALKRLAAKYAMPARMWRHGIHSFLELLRHRLPDSLEHMLTFIYLAYSMMALLFETVPAFEDTWIECLGDLGRYRMAIEDEDIRDREIWTGVSRLWYSKASDRAPTTGRLYHHLAILARPNHVMQLYYYGKSLCVPVPFLATRESIMTLFDPVLTQNQPRSMAKTDVDFVTVHGILFSGKNLDRLPAARDGFLGGLDLHISRTTRRWMEIGYHVGIANCCAIMDYGREDNLILQAIKPPKTEEGADIEMTDSPADVSGTEATEAIALSWKTHEIVFRRFGDNNIYAYLHVSMVFLYHMTFYPVAMESLEKRFPFKLLALMLNTLVVNNPSSDRIQSQEFPGPLNGEAPRPLPEDFAMRGLLWTDRYFPDSWFTAAKVDDDEKYFEVASMTDERRERILWLGCRVAEHQKWLTYDPARVNFDVVKEYDAIEPLSVVSAGEPMNIEAESPSPSERPSSRSSSSQTGDEDQTESYLEGGPTRHVSSVGPG
jgi:hypothetical protein